MNTAWNMLHIHLSEMCLASHYYRIKKGCFCSYESLYSTCIFIFFMGFIVLPCALICLTRAARLCPIIIMIHLVDIEIKITH